jgi:nitrogen fixation NifU-like protein
MYDLYGDILLDHFRFPRHQGRLESPSVSTEGVNPLCGDQLTIDLKFAENRLTDISFMGSGCAISMASASMLTESLRGKTVEEIREWITRVREFLKDGAEPAGFDLGDISALSGIAQLPVRVKCAALPWTTIEQGLIEYLDKAQ